MTHEDAFLQAMVEDASSALLFADWLEERGDLRGELLRLTHILTQRTDQPNRPVLEERLRALVADSVPPVGPFYTNSLGMKLAWIPPGTFLMGKPPNEAGQGGKPQHQVTLTKGFWMGIHQVTQAQWQVVMGTTPSRYEGDFAPVEQISWDDAVAFCKAVSRRDSKAYRLPTEAEWEYACRAGTTTPFHFGSTISTDLANYDGKAVYGNGKKGVYRRKPTPVGKFPPNAWGLCDMHGNVWEWCADWYGEYADSHLTDPKGPKKGAVRVMRGGGWCHNAGVCRSASRRAASPGDSNTTLGLRACFRLD